MRRHFKSVYGFTLVELLVVIAIIGALIALLLPLVMGARRQGVQVVCASNLHQLGVAMQAYTDQNGSFPGADFISPRGSANGGVVECWPVRLRKFLGGNQRVFYCPAQDPRCEWKPDAPGVVELAQVIHTNFGYELYERLLIDGPFTTDPALTGTFFSYGYNARGAPGGAGFPSPRGLGEVDYQEIKTEIKVQFGEVKKRTAVRNPSEFIMIADSTANGKGDFHIFAQNTSTEPGTENVIGNIHSGGANVLFCDGHVHWCRQSDVTFKWPPAAEDAAKQRLWNADGAPSRAW